MVSSAAGSTSAGNDTAGLLRRMAVPAQPPGPPPCSPRASRRPTTSRHPDRRVTPQVNPRRRSFTCRARCVRVGRFAFSRPGGLARHRWGPQFRRGRKISRPSSEGPHVEARHQTPPRRRHHAGPARPPWRPPSPPPRPRPGRRTTPASAASASRADNRPGPRTAEMQQKREKALAMLANGSAKLKQRSEGATVALGDGEFVEFPIEKTDKIFTILSEFGTTGSGKLGTTPGPLHNADPAARPRDRQLDLLAARLQQGALRGDVQRRRRVVQELLHAALLGPLHGDQHRDRLGEGAGQRIDVRRQRGRGRRRLVGLHRRLRRLLVRLAGRRRQDAPPRSTTTSPSSTCGTATTSTATATSTRPTATSTTSRPCTPVRARRPAPTRTPSGRTAGTSARATAPTGPASAARTTSAAARRSVGRSTSSATTPSSPRTAAWASSPTSSATTSACPTTTTPRAARTARRSGR